MCMYNVWLSTSFCLWADGIIIKMILYQDYSQITYVVQDLSYRLTFFKFILPLKTFHALWVIFQKFFLSIVKLVVIDLMSSRTWNLRI